jgi:hypothetical protein
MGLRVFACALGVALTSSAAIAGTEPVEIPDGDLTLHAMLYRPDGPGPFPAVVALHDCGGLKRRPNTEAQLYSIWANKLVADGFQPRATMRSRAFRNGWRDNLAKTPRRMFGAAARYRTGRSYLPAMQVAPSPAPAMTMMIPHLRHRAALGRRGTRQRRNRRGLRSPGNGRQ